MRPLKFFSALLITSTLLFSCKKESSKKEEQKNEEAAITVSLEDLSYTTYEIGMLEAGEGETFESINVSIGGVAVPSEKTADGAVAFIIPQEAGIGAKQLKAIANGKEFSWNITITASASQSVTLTQLTSSYQQELELHRQEVAPLMDSVSKWLGTTIPHVPLATLQQLNDSVAYYTQQLNQLSTEAKEVAKHLIYAQLEDLKEIRQLSRDLLDRQYANLQLMKRADCSSEWEAECILEDAKTIIAALTVKLRVNARKAAGLGVLTGLAVAALGYEPIAVEAGSAAAFLYLGIFTARDIYNSWDELQFSTFNYLIAKVSSILGSDKKEIELLNNTPRDFTYSIVGKNLASSDKKYNVSWMTSFISVFDRFRGKWMEYMPEWVEYAPDYAPFVTKPQKVKDLKYLSVTNISNPFVSFDGISGSTSNPSLKFSTTSSSDEIFSFRITYDDGAFKVVSDPVDCILKKEVDSLALYNNMMPGFWTVYYYNYEFASTKTNPYLHSVSTYQLFADGRARLLTYTSKWTLSDGSYSDVYRDYSNNADWESDPLLKSNWEVRKQFVDNDYGYRYILVHSGMYNLPDLKTKTAEGRWGQESGYRWVKD